MSRFRKEYRELSQEEKDTVAWVKVSAEALESFIEQVPSGREKSLALTKLEEAVMWAVKGVTG